MTNYLLVSIVSFAVFIGGIQNAQSGELIIRQVDREKASFVVGQENCEIRLEIENTGEQSVSFDSVSISCGCVKSNIEPKKFLPGEKKVYRLTVKTDKSGEQGATVHLEKTSLASPIAFCDVKFTVQGPFDVLPNPCVLKNVNPLLGTRFALQVVDALSNPVPSEEIIVNSLSDRILVESLEDGKINLRVIPSSDTGVADGFVLIRVPKRSTRFEKRHQVKWEYEKSGYEVLPKRLFVGRLTEGDSREFEFNVISHVDDSRFEVESIELQSALELRGWRQIPTVNGGEKKLKIVLTIDATKAPAAESKYYSGNLEVAISRDGGKSSHLAIPISAAYGGREK
jgi:hypothetical protein